MVNGIIPAAAERVRTAEDYLIEEYLATSEAYVNRDLDTTKNPNLVSDNDDAPAVVPVHAPRRNVKTVRERKIIDSEWGIWDHKNAMHKLTIFFKMQLKDPNAFQRHQYEMTLCAAPVFTQWCMGIPWVRLNIQEAMRQIECAHSCSAVTIIVRRQAGKTEWVCVSRPFFLKVFCLGSEVYCGSMCCVSNR